MPDDRKATNPAQPPGQAPQKEAQTSPPVLAIDYEYYERYLTDYDLSDEEKRDFIACLASIMMAWVDLGFRLEASGEPLEKPPQKPAENIENIEEKASELLADMVDYSSVLQDNLTPNAGPYSPGGK